MYDDDKILQWGMQAGFLPNDILVCKLGLVCSVVDGQVVNDRYLGDWIAVMQIERDGSDWYKWIRLDQIQRNLTAEFEFL